MPDMIRKAFKLSVYPDQHAEYVLRHNPIWPELETVLPLPKLNLS
jgi:L-rhamnose mutarotase